MMSADFEALISNVRYIRKQLDAAIELMSGTTYVCAICDRTCKYRYKPYHIGCCKQGSTKVVAKRLLKDADDFVELKVCDDCWYNRMLNTEKDA